MHRLPPLASSRGLRAAALAVAPVVVVLAGPVSATPAVDVTPAPQVCAVVVTLTGLTEGVHTAVVRATVPGSGDPVPVLPAAPTVPPPAPTPSPVPGPPQGEPVAPAPEPVLSAEHEVTRDGEVVVLLDGAAVPDDDPRVVVDVTVDGEAAAPVELALPGCVPPTTAPPETSPTSAPTTAPTSAPGAGSAAGPVASPGATPTPTASPVPSAAPATASPTASAAPPSPVPTTAPRPTSVTTAAPSPLPSPLASPVLVATPVALPTPMLSPTLEQAFGAAELGTGSSGSLSLMSFTAAPELEVAPAPEPVPAPVIAAPEGSAAGVLAAPGTSTPLEDLLPLRPQDGGDTVEDDPVTAQLAAPELATDAVADPLVDLAPAAFVLSASLGGLLVAGRRRTS